MGLSIIMGANMSKVDEAVVRGWRGVSHAGMLDTFGGYHARGLRSWWGGVKVPRCGACSFCRLRVGSGWAVEYACTVAGGGWVWDARASACGGFVPQHVRRLGFAGFRARLGGWWKRGILWPK